MKHLVLAALAAFAPLSAAAQDDHDHEGESHVFEAAGLHVVHPWTRASATGTAFVFMEIENEGSAPVTLLGAATEDGAPGALVGFALENGEEAWQVLEGVSIAAGRHLDLAPQVLAIRLTDLKETLDEGDHLHLTLETSAGPLELEAEVQDAGATAHSHAGHQH